MRQSKLVLLCLFFACYDACERTPYIGSSLANILDYVTDSQNCLSTQWKKYSNDAHLKMRTMLQKVQFFATLGDDSYMELQRSFKLRKVDMNLTYYKQYMRYVVNSSAVTESLIKKYNASGLNATEDIFWGLAQALFLSGAKYANRISQKRDLLIPGCDVKLTESLLQLFDFMVDEMSLCASQYVNVEPIQHELSSAIYYWSQKYDAFVFCLSRNTSVDAGKCILFAEFFADNQYSIQGALKRADLLLDKFLVEWSLTMLDCLDRLKIEGVAKSIKLSEDFKKCAGEDF